MYWIQYPPYTTPYVLCDSKHIEKTLQHGKRKLEWVATEIDNLLVDVDPIPGNYGRFVELMRMASNKHIQRGIYERESSTAKQQIYIDDILVEQLKNLSLSSHKWLL